MLWVNAVMINRPISIIVLLPLAMIVFVARKLLYVSLSSKDTDRLKRINKIDPDKNAFVDMGYAIVYDKTYGVNIIVYPSGQQHIYFDSNGKPLDALDVLSGRTSQ